MKLKSTNLRQLISNTVRALGRYRVLIFIVLICAVYGYVLFSINTLSNQQPSTENVSTELSTIRTPKIDKSVVKQLQDLRDNSVSVQSLFEQARNNPFNE